MLRYVVCGSRNFSTYPDIPARRLNWEFFALNKGSVYPVFSDRRIKSPPDSNFWVIPPNIQYCWHSNGTKTCQRTVIHFAYTPSVLTDEIKKSHIIALHLSKAELDRVKDIARRLLIHERKPNQFSLLVLEQAVIELTLLALKDVKLRPQSTLATFNHERVERAIAWYGEQMHTRPSLKQVAEGVHISPSHVRKLFYDTLKTSPKTIFTKLKLQRACDILATTSSSLDQVASRCGFLNAVDLCRVFKKFHRISPGAWRKRISTVS
jgi:AraC family transcriptional regulator